MDKEALWFLTVAAVPALIFTHPPGALVGFAAMTGLMLLGSRKAWALLPPAALLLVVAALFAPETLKARMDPGQGL